ncbi:hypothetical protein F53441_1193 [Fusarium austroafricanum]|uniref:Carbohydrate-binding domain-containing protein n=1 Tax=Fusarium austroafricanum TaxID=2364996 RepID=A0A8H4KT15_9HYPO|nr:hypothetical protein F53441_1193 [Fusarium austroafricanum]
MHSSYFLAFLPLAAAHIHTPSVSVPACPNYNTVKFSKSVPDQKPFPRTMVDLCYTDTSLSLQFTALDEKNFYYNSSQGTNDDIWEYEVVEAFIYKGTDDPQTYLEYEINPNNVTYQAFVYNPSKDRSEGAPFDHFFISDPEADGFEAETELNKRAKKWVSKVKIPLGLFNVDPGCAKGTKWRMNFFRTVTSPKTFPDQGLGGWSSPDKASFHITKFFGRVDFV